MDVVYVLLGLGFFLLSYVLVQLIGRLQEHGRERP